MIDLIPARPTTYRGIKMRSRLEASVAAEFDQFGYEWAYEPRAYANASGQYLPDFQILTMPSGPLPRPTFMEVRPTIERAYLAMSQMPIIWDSEPRAFLIIHVPGEDGLSWFASGSESRRWLIGRSS